jgi:DNA-binding beta-propeller fold protein YncE
MMTFWIRGSVLAAVCGVAGLAVAQQAPVERPGGRIDLPSSKQIVGVVPGSPQQLSSTPVSMAVSPDGRYVVTVNGGYGSYEGGYDQSLAVLDTTTNTVTDFPDTRTLGRSNQVLFSGLAFSADGKKLYGSLASLTDPTGKTDGDTGSGIQVYGFADGKLTRERVLKIPMQKLAAGRRTKLGVGREGSESDMGVPYPAAIVVVGSQLLVADNLSDDVLLMDAESGKVTTRFDLSESDVVPSTYPAALALSKGGKRAFVGLWNASEVVELDLAKGMVGRKLTLLKPDSDVKPSSHPTALVTAPDGQTVYVALGNRDAIAAVDLTGGGFKLKGFYDVRLPGQSYFGALPEALAVNADGSRLYVANLGSDAVAVIDTKKLTKGVAEKGMAEPVGFIPTEWMPTGVAFSAGKIVVASGKGTGTGPNNFAQRPTAATGTGGRFAQPFSYIATLLHGSIATVDEKAADRDLKALTAEALEDNRMKAAAETMAFKGGSSPIKHVIYIIKENRTYDQILGDLALNGAPVGNGDKSLTMYGADVTPNLHKLALQFGVLDNFYDSGEVSGDGHVWSNSAINSDYNERTWQLNYRGSQRGYDYEGVVSNGIPLEQHIPDVAEPGTGYLWGDADKNGKTHYNFGEFIASTFCAAKGTSIAQKDSRQGPLLEGKTCAQRNEVKPGEMLPVEWGGGPNKWPWAIPLLESNHATKPELVGHFAVESPDFNLRVPDQIRVNVLERHLQGWIAEKQAGKDTMPNFITMRLGNDHTAGTTPGGPTPKASVADNDLAVGRIVDMISHSPFWDDTAICVLEDDAQNGADHVDAHRSIALLVSKYAPRTADAKPFVDSRFYSTVSMVRTMEVLLGLPPMNNNDAFASMIGTVFTGAGDQPAFTADMSNAQNNLIYTANPPNARGGRASAKMDFTHEDRADPRKLNVILWQDAMGSQPVPAMLLVKQAKKKDDDD